MGEVLVEALQAVIRTYYHVLDGRRFDRELEGARVGGFVFDPPGGEPERTVVLVHGLGDASTTWWSIVPELRERTRLVVPDMPPFGVSELAEGYALVPEEHARLLAPIVAEHATGPTTVVGQSMGGWIVQWLARQRPELVDGAVLVATAGARLEGSFDAVDLLTPHSPEETRAYLDALWYRTPIGVGAVLDEVSRRLHEPRIRAFLTATEIGHTLTAEDLAAVEVPVHVVWGREDGLLDPGTPAWLAEHWGGPVQRTYLARAGHMIHRERPEALVGFVEAMADRVEAAARPVPS